MTSGTQAIFISWAVPFLSWRFHLFHGRFHLFRGGPIYFIPASHLCTTLLACLLACWLPAFFWLRCSDFCIPNEAEKKKNADKTMWKSKSSLVFGGPLSAVQSFCIPEAQVSLSGRKRVGCSIAYIRSKADPNTQNTRVVKNAKLVDRSVVCCLSSNRYNRILVGFQSLHDLMVLLLWKKTGSITND